MVKARINDFRLFDEAVGERRFAVINVRDDAEIADILRVCHNGTILEI
jgi:hypothetical protein